MGATGLRLGFHISGLSSRFVESIYLVGFRSRFLHNRAKALGFRITGWYTSWVQVRSRGGGRTKQ